MTDNRNISFEESDDPQAKQTNETVYMLYTRDPVRTPFQWDDSANAGFSSTTGKTWLPIHQNYRTVNLKAEKEATKSTFKLYQRLIQMRRENTVLRTAPLQTKVVSEEVFGFVRPTAEVSIAVFVNLGNAKQVSLRDLLTPADFNTNLKAKVLVANNNSTLNINDMVDILNIPLGQYDAVVLEVRQDESSTTGVPITTTTVATTTQGASSTIVSMTLVMFVIVASFFV